MQIFGHQQQKLIIKMSSTRREFAVGDQKAPELFIIVAHLIKIRIT